MNWTEITETLQYLSEPAYLYIGGGALVLALLLILLKRRQPKHVVAYTTENGGVMVSRSAIVELVRTSCEQLDHVSKPNVRIKIKGRHTHINVSLKLSSGGRLKTIEQTLQSHLRQQLADSLGIENLGKINIIATGLKSGKMALAAPSNSEAALPSATEASEAADADPEEKPN
jgi:uncharacterized alkaline shock family protein YloU